jgi:hypothetical protein
MNLFSYLFRSYRGGRMGMAYHLINTLANMEKIYEEEEDGNMPRGAAMGSL